MGDDRRVGLIENGKDSFANQKHPEGFPNGSGGNIIRFGNKNLKNAICKRKYSSRVSLIVFFINVSFKIYEMFRY